MHPKSFYYNYHANNEIFEIDMMLINEVMKDHPRSVFDFGTGTGKNLRLLQDKLPTAHLCGLDMSFLNIIHARAQNNLPFLIIGEEWHLSKIRNFDMVITCSVLCHIQDISDIINEFKMIASKSIIIAETNDVVGEFYYPHDYESFGFIDTGKKWFSPGNGANYKIYKMGITL
jgi:trans-aconitate methyltransferase